MQDWLFSIYTTQNTTYMYNILYINQNTQEVIHYERLYLDKRKQMCKLMVGKYAFDKSTSGQTITSLYNLLVCVLL